jgi:hypothetical protein
MKIEIQGIMQFTIPLTLEHIEVLEIYSKRHYDATCRSASSPSNDQHNPFAGLLIGWGNSIRFYHDCGSPEKAHVTATELQLDLLQKCMEYTNPGTTPEQEALRRDLQRVFR